jgi:acyl-CoA dehydrogenase
VPVLSYPRSEADREIQAAARAFVDELIPHEVEAELHDGELPAELLERQRRRVHELGFDAVNMPKELGGGGFTAFQQVLVQEQVGRATNALGWVIHTPASWLPQVATDEQLERWVVPTIRGQRRECYAITEEAAGSDVDAIEATALLDGDGYLLNGVKWHVTSFNHADHVFLQAKLAAGPNAGAHAMFVIDLDTPASGWSARPPTATPSPTTTRWSPSRTCASPPASSSARRATAWASPTSGSGTSGS